MKLTKSKLQSIIREELLNEIGDLSNTYSYRQTVDRSGVKEYTFKTEDNLEVMVSIGYDSIKDYWEISYIVIKDGQYGSYSDVVGHSNTFKVMATIIKIIEEFYTRYKDDVETLYFSGAEDDKSDSTANRRLKVYKGYLKRRMPPNADINVKGNGVTIKFK